MLLQTVHKEEGLFTDSSVVNVHRDGKSESILGSY